MILKFIILMLIAFAAAKACGLDEILDELYDDFDIEEDDDTSSPAPNSTTAAPTTASPSSTPGSAPTSAPSTTTPASPTSNAPRSTTTPSNSSSTPQSITTPSNSSGTPQSRARGKLRRHSLHRLLLRRANKNEGRDLYSTIDRMPYPTRYASNHPKGRSLVYKPSEIIEEEEGFSDADEAEDDHLEGQGRSGSMLVVPLENEDENEEGHFMDHKRINEEGILKSNQNRYESASGGLVYEVLRKRHPLHRHSSTAHAVRDNPPKHRPRKQAMRPSLVDIFIVNNYPTKVDSVDKNQGQQQMIPKVNRKVVNRREHLMVQGQNPRRPILTRPPKFSDELTFDEKLHPSKVHKPCASVESVNEINRVKEHIIRESIKIDPKDHSEIRNIEEKIRYSVIKKPCAAPESSSQIKVPSLSEAIANIDLPEASTQGEGAMDKQDMNIKGQLPINDSSMIIQQVPLPNSNVKFRPVEISNTQRPDIKNVTDDKKEPLELSHNINPVNSKLGIYEHYEESSPIPSQVGNRVGVLQEKNTYVDPTSEKIKYTSVPVAPNNNSELSHPVKPYPLISEYNVYGSVPDYPINNPEIGRHPQPPKDHLYLQLPSVDIANTFKGPNREGQAHEHHFSIPNPYEHSVVSPTPSTPTKIMNVV